MLENNDKYALDHSSDVARKHALGSNLNRKVGVIRAVYDFSLQGGAVGTVNLLEQDQEGLVKAKVAKLPDNAIIKQVMIDIQTAMASAGGTGTIALGANTTVDLLAAVDADTLSGLVAGIPVGSAATAVKLTAERNLTATIGAEALTAGKIEVFVEYYLASA